MNPNVRIVDFMFISRHAGVDVWCQTSASPTQGLSVLKLQQRVGLSRRTL